MAAVISEALRGWDGCLAAAEEVTWATAVTPSTHFLPYLSNTIQADEPVEEIPYMAAVNATQAAHVGDTSVVTGHDVGGDVTTIAAYDRKAFILFCAHLLGVAPSTSGSGPYVHTLLLGAAGALPGLTGQNVVGAHSSLSVGEVIPGLIPTSLELSWSGRDNGARAKFSCLGWKSNGMAAVSGTVAIADAEEILGSHLGVLSWNSGSYQLNSGTLKIDRQLGRRFNSGNGLYTDKPQPTGRTMITLDAELDITTYALETARAAGTKSNAVLTFTGSGNNSLTITLNQAQVVKSTRDDGSKHVRTAQVQFRAHYVDASNRGVKFVFQNDNAAAV